MEVEKIPFPIISCRIRTEHLISHASKVMLTIFQARFQQYVNQELSDIYKLDLEKAEEPEIKLPISVVGS